jgi:hypothetical protein
MTALEDRVEALEDRLFALPVPETRGVPFVAAKLGVTVTYLYDHPEAQPSHGVSDVPGKKLWLFATIRQWIAIPARKHIEDWEALPSRTKAAIAAKRGRS